MPSTELGRLRLGRARRRVRRGGGVYGRVGATQGCVLVAEDDSPTDVTATAESVNGETVNITFDVHDDVGG